MLQLLEHLGLLNESLPFYFAKFSILVEESFKDFDWFKCFRINYLHAIRTRRPAHRFQCQDPCRQSWTSRGLSRCCILRSVYLATRQSASRPPIDPVLFLSRFRLAHLVKKINFFLLYFLNLFRLKLGKLSSSKFSRIWLEFYQGDSIK